MRVGEKVGGNPLTSAETGFALAPRVFVSLFCGSIGLLVLGLQPILLGALFSEGRVDFNGLAGIATLEIITIGLGSVLFVALLSVDHMRRKAGLLLLLVAAGHALTALSHSLPALLFVRGVTGLLEGGLVAVAVEMVARTDSPPRAGGWFVFLQTFLQSLIAAALALLIVPQWGAAGGFLTLAVFTVASLSPIRWLISDYGPMPAAAQTGNMERTGEGRLSAALALGCIFALYLFIGAIWAFLEPLGGQFGIEPATIGVMVSLSLVAQMMGALAAVPLEGRFDFRIILAGAAIIAIAIALLYGSGPTASLFWVLTLATGFLWLFVVPWQIAMTLAADPSRRTALLVPASQLFGAALGPAGAAMLISTEDYRGVAWFGAAAALGSLICLGAMLATLRNKKKHRGDFTT